MDPTPHDSPTDDRPLGAAERQMLIDLLDQQLGTSDIVRADSYLDDPLRMLTHLIMSQPEYQLG